MSFFITEDDWNSFLQKRKAGNDARPIAEDVYLFSKLGVVPFESAIRLLDPDEVVTDGYLVFASGGLITLGAHYQTEKASAWDKPVLEFQKPLL